MVSEVSMPHMYFFHEPTTTVNNAGLTALHGAAENGHLSVVKALLARDFKPNKGAHIILRSDAFSDVRA